MDAITKIVHIHDYGNSQQTADIVRHLEKCVIHIHPHQVIQRREGPVTRGGSTRTFEQPAVHSNLAPKATAKDSR